jgi:hypothetical protein
MNHVDIYISEIGRRLPAKNRKDIEAEIRSVLQDNLDERSKQTGKPVDDEMILEVLQQYGSPEAVAASYQGERYLIGPRLYPTFEKVLFAILPVTIILALVGLGISLSFTHSTARDLIALSFQTFWSMVGSVATTIGALVLIFSILERTVPDLQIKSKEKKAWDAHSLLKISPPDLIKPAGLMVEIFFNGLAILIFNFFPQFVRFTPSMNALLETGNWQNINFIPFLSEAFLRLIPFLTVVWVLTIALDIILLQRGHWQVWSLWSAIAIKTLGLIIAVVLLTGPSLVTLSAEALSDPEGMNILATMLNLGIFTGLGVAVIVGSIDLVKMILRQIRGMASLSHGVR